MTVFLASINTKIFHWDKPDEPASRYLDNILLAANRIEFAELSFGMMPVP